MGTIPTVTRNQCRAIANLSRVESRIGRFETGKNNVEGEAGETIEWGIVIGGYCAKGWPIVEGI